MFSLYHMYSDVSNDVLSVSKGLNILLSQTDVIMYLDLLPVVLSLRVTLYCVIENVCSVEEHV